MLYTKKLVKEKKSKIDNLQDLRDEEKQNDEINSKDGLLVRRIPTRQSIHQEIEKKLIDKLFTIIETIEELPNGKLDFAPYQDSDLIRIEALLEKKFEEKIFDRERDVYILEFLEQIKNERVQRDF